MAIAEHEDQEDHEHLLPHRAEVTGYNRFRSISDPLTATFKSMFQRSTPLPEDVMWTQPGPMDQGKLEILLKRHSSRGGVASFKMLPGSYIGYNGLAHVLEIMANTSPMVRDVVLYSQVYTLVSPSAPLIFP